MNAASLGRTYANGEIVVGEGEAGDCMFVLQKGQLEVLRRARDGEVRLSVMGPGDIFGEMAIFEGEVRSATVRALGEASVLTIDRKTFLRRVQEDPSLAFNLVRTLSKRVRRLSAEVVEAKAGRPRRQDSSSLPGNARQVERRRKPDRRGGVERRRADHGRATGPAVPGRVGDGA